MTKKQTELARRTVVHKLFEWMPGMMRQDGCRYMGSGLWAEKKDTAGILVALHLPDQYPDLTDPATLGCIVTLTRAAWKDKGLYACLNHRGWSIPVYAYSVDCTNAGSMVGRYYATEAEAWIHSFLESE
jgi:hypothetical protein